MLRMHQHLSKLQCEPQQLHCMLPPKIPFGKQVSLQSRHFRRSKRSSFYLSPVLLLLQNLLKYDLHMSFLPHIFIQDPQQCCLSMQFRLLLKQRPYLCQMSLSMRRLHWAGPSAVHRLPSFLNEDTTARQILSLQFRLLR
jgi:hypothetical protein